MTLNFDFVAGIPNRGIRRAAVFLGLGVNAARDPSFKNYQLENISLFRVVPDGLPDEKIEEFKKKFEGWVISCALREFVESYAVFLDHVHRSCLLMATSKGRVKPVDAESWGPAFERKGLDQKLSLLRRRFNITTERETYFTGIKQARNCISHRGGVVGIEDVDEADSILRLQWWRMEVLAQMESGREKSLMPPVPRGGVLFEEPGQVCVRFSRNVKEYKVGDILRLSPNDISEILLLASLTTGDILKGLIEYSQSIGIQIKPKNPEQDSGGNA